MERPLLRRAGFLLLALAIAVAAIAGALDFWGTRFDLNPDGISYLDMARHGVVSRTALINGYWSPGYPLLLSLLAAAGLSLRSVPALHVVNLALFPLVLAAGFILACRVCVARAIGRSVALIGCTLIALQCIGIGLLTPDMGVMMIVLLAAGLIFWLEDEAHSWRAALLLGLCLGVGYWWKAIILPAGVTLLATMLIYPPCIERARLKVLTAGAVLLCVSAPLIVMVSRHVGHRSFGEVGRLNYAWQVDGVTPYVGWLGDSTSRYGRPIHPPRLVATEPLTVEFATPVPGTYPLWFEPSYWYAGLEPRFEVSGQWHALLASLGDFGNVLLDLWAVFATGILLLATTRGENWERPADAPRAARIALLWCVEGIAIYLLVHVEARYIAGFIAVTSMLGAGALARRRRTQFTWPAAALAVLLMIVSMARNLARNTGGYPVSYRPSYMIVADTLRAHGIRRGQLVAVVGDAFEQYATLASETRVGAQVLDSTGFWQIPAERRAELQRRIASTGARVLIANDIDTSAVRSGWIVVPHDDGRNTGLLMLGNR